MNISIGNDIVDLTDPDIASKHENERFLRRVLSPSELELIKNADDPKKTLWILWSGKEAAYKVLKKLLPNLIFAHSKIIVQVADELGRGTVEYQDKTVSLRWHTSEQWIHCVGLLQSDEKHLEILEYDVKELERVSVEVLGFSAEERLSIHSAESAGARSLTKSLLKKHLSVEPQIIRFPLEKRFSPPQLYISEIPLKSWDLSMSHDGKFVSCAVSRHKLV